MKKPDPKSMDVLYDDRKIIVNPHVAASLLQEEIEKMKAEAAEEKRLKQKPLEVRARNAFEVLVRLHCEQQRLWGMIPSQAQAEAAAKKAIEKIFIELSQEEKGK